MLYWYQCSDTEGIMNNKLELLMKLTELSEQIKYSKKHRHKHINSIACDKGIKSEKHKNRLSFTAKRMICILLEEESINQRSISKMLGVSAQTVSEMIKNLEAKDLITKSQGEINNENMIALTEHGKETALETRKSIAKRADKTFNGLSKEEIQTLSELLDKISRNNLGEID